MIPRLLWKAGQCWCHLISFLVNITTRWNLKCSYPTNPGIIEYIKCFPPYRPLRQLPWFPKVIWKPWCQTCHCCQSIGGMFWESFRHIQSKPEIPVSTRASGAPCTDSKLVNLVKFAGFSKIIRPQPKEGDSQNMFPTWVLVFGVLRRWDWSFGWQLDVPGLDEWSLAFSQQFHVQSLPNSYNSSIKIRFFEHWGHHYIGSCCWTHCTILQPNVYLGHQNPINGWRWSKSWPLICIQI